MCGNEIENCNGFQVIYFQTIARERERENICSLFINIVVVYGYREMKIPFVVVPLSIVGFFYLFIYLLMMMTNSRVDFVEIIIVV